MRTFEEIRALLAEKFSKEKKRLKTYGTKANAFDLANAVARYVQALMAESRYRELRRTYKFVQKHGRCDPKDELHPYLEDRLKGTKLMTTALGNVAIKAEGERPYKPKPKPVEPPKEKHHKHHHKHHHKKRKHGSH